MRKKEKTIQISLIAVAILSLVIICVSIFNSKPKTLEEEKIRGILTKEYTVEDIVNNEEETKVVIVGDLSREDAVTLAKEVNEKVEIERLNFLFTKDSNIKLEDGFYSEGMLRGVEINNKDKQMNYSEFRDESIDVKSSIEITDLSYNSIDKIDEIVYMDVTSSEINNSNYKEQLYQLAKVVNNLNKGLKNVVITTKVDNITYGVALSNPNVVKVIENIEF